MKRFALFTSLVLGIPAAGGLVIAQTASSPAKTAAPAPAAQNRAPAPSADLTPCGKPVTGAMGPMMEGGMMGGGMMGGGMMGGGMMGGGMMGGGMGPMMNAATKIAVKNVDKGVTMTFTSDDAATVARLRKMAEGMRLMHEAMASER